MRVRAARPTHERHHVLSPRSGAGAAVRRETRDRRSTQHVVEIISDSGEGAQRCGQALGAIAARMGNGVWTVEIIPAEIRPPARSVAGASGNRIRLGARRVTNGGDETDLVVAFNEQVLLGRVRAGELKPDCTILLESMWRDDADPAIAASYVRDVRPAGRGRLSRSTRSRWSASAARSCPTRGAARTCSRSACCAASTAWICSSRATRSRSTFGKKAASGRRDQRRGCSRPATRGPRRNLDFKYRIPGGARDRAADRRQRQHRARARRAGLRAWRSARCTRSRRRPRRRTI